MEIFKLAYFSEEHPPQWNCPSCSKGFLDLVDKIHFKENAATLINKGHEQFDHDWVNYNTSALFQCNNSRCQESVSMVGSGFIEQEYSYDSDGNAISEYKTYCTPMYFHPSLKIFQIPEQVTEDVRDMLHKSFSLFFCDKDSCVNRIRASVEVLLGEFGIAAEDQNGKFINLHSRINELSIEHKDIKELLTAIKWKGNIGSHGKGKSKIADVINVYKIIKHVLDDLYKVKDERKELLELAGKINKAKGK